MQFLVIGMDGDDAEALDRRLANRDAHLAKARALFATGNLVSAGALVDDDGRMMGSAVQYDFPSREELDAVLEDEPYITGGVWLEVSIRTIRLADLSAA